MNTLFVNNKRYNTETLGILPKEIQAEAVARQTNNGVTAFFTKSSTLSNHYLSKMIIDGKEYITNEQYNMVKKTLTFGDLEIAKPIMASKTAKTQKSLGDNNNIKNL